MLKLAVMFVLGGLPTGYLNVPNDGASQCRQIDDEVGRFLERARDDHEKSKIYFDLLQWRCEDEAIWDARRYSEALETMGEPSFARRSNAKGYESRLRLLVFSHTGAGYALRLDYRPDGTAFLHFAEAEWVERKGDRLVRRLKRKWSRPLAPNAAHAFLAEVEKADILQRQFEQGDIEVSKKQADGSKAICINWATAILERLDAQGRHTVAQTGCGRTEAILPIIDAFHALIGVAPITLKPLNG